MKEYQHPYCVTYQHYQEYDQFSGHWSDGIERFTTMRDAEDFIESIKNNTDYDTVQGPWIHKDKIYED